MDNEHSLPCIGVYFGSAIHWLWSWFFCVFGVETSRLLLGASVRVRAGMEESTSWPCMPMTMTETPDVPNYSIIKYYLCIAG